MQHVLVHIDKGLGPIGAWSYLDGALKHFYPESLDVSISARARQVMAERHPAIGVADWFGYIAEHYENVADEFETIDLELPLSLPSILAEFRRSWAANAEPS